MKDERPLTNDELIRQNKELRELVQKMPLDRVFPRVVQIIKNKEAPYSLIKGFLDAFSESLEKTYTDEEKKE